MKLSKRLQFLADVIEKYKQGSKLADIGTDHAYLPCYLVENEIICHGYACDVANGPFESSKATIKQYDLEGKVTPLLGSGLTPVIDKQVDMISICGMGAYLISEILDEHLDYLKNVKILFLQANANVDHLRAYLFDHYFQIVDEQMIKDSGHIYEVIVVTKRVDKDLVYTNKDIEFGPILSANQPPLFKEKWKKQYRVLQNIKNGLSDTHPKYSELDNKMKIIEEVLYESK